MSCAVASSPLAAAALLAPSPFRPPKIPIRSLPRKKNAAGPSPIQPLAAVTAKPAAVGVQIHRTSAPSSPVAPSPVHSSPASLRTTTPKAAGPPVAVGVGMPTKALPIINKQTGEAIVPVNGHANATGIPPVLAPVAATTQPKVGPPTPPIALSVDAFEVPAASLEIKKGTSPRDTLSPSSPAASSEAAPASVLSPLQEALSEGLISSQSVAARVYSTKEMMSLRGTMNACPETLLQLVLSGELFPNCPSRYKAAQAAAAATGNVADDSNCLGRDAFGAASTSLDKAAAVRLRQVKETHQKVMSVLSRVTPEKYEALKRELLDLPLRQTDEKQLKQVVNVFFEKAVQEPLYSELYASLVSHMCSLTEAERQLPREEKDKLFAFRMRRELLNKCQEEFTKPIATTTDDHASLSEGEVEELRRKYKKRLCGNIKFVCELYARSLVTDRVIDSILNTLTGMRSDEDYVAEAIATTLNSAGSAFAQLQPEAFARHMKYCTDLQRNHPSTRIRFLMMDLEDSRRRGFEKRKQVMTQEELDRQQFEDQKKFQEDIEKALREQNARGPRRSKIPKPAAPQTPNNGPGTLALTTPTNAEPQAGSRREASVPGSPVTPLRGAKMPRGTRIEHGTVLAARFDVGTPSSLVSPISENPTPTAPTFGFYKDPSAAASTNSLSSLGPFTPTGDAKQTLTKEQVEKTSRELMSALAVGDVTPEQVVSRIEHDLPEVHQRRAVLGGWLRRAVATTKLFTEREQLPALFHALLLTAVKDDSSPVLPLDEIARAMNEWIVNDIDCQQYDNCPRMFANWASVLEAASKFSTCDSSLDLDPATLVQPGTLNLFLQELRAHSESNAVFEQFVREVSTPADAAAENNLQKVLRDVASMLQDVPEHSTVELIDRHMSLLQRFRPTAHLAYVENTNVEELLQKALQNPKLKDDLELLHLRSFLLSPPTAIAEECRAQISSSSRTSALSPVHLLMKVLSAALGVLLPFHASTIQPEGGRNFFSSAAVVTPDRVAAVSAFLRSMFTQTCSKVSAEVAQWLGASGQVEGIARRLCGIAVMSEVLHHITFAVSENTNRSVPASPTNPHTPIIPLPRAVSSSSVSNLFHAQLEFEQSFATQLTARLNEVFVVAEATRLVPEVCRTEVTTAIQDAVFDFWFVSPPSSFRSTRTVLGISLSPPIPEASREASCEDLTTPPRRSGSREYNTGYSLHSRTLATSIAQGFLPVAAQ